MRRTFIAALITAIFAVAIPAAYAAVNFHYANASIDKSTGALAVSFKVSGLGNDVTSVDVSISGSASADYGCINGGGHHPSATNKESLQGPLPPNSTTFPVRNGSASGTVFAGPLDPGDFSCPSGQTAYLTAVGYSGTTLSMTNTAGTFSTPVSGTLSASGLRIAVG